MLFLILSALYIYFTPPGLHYLAILYSAIGILIMNSIRLLILQRVNRKSIIPYLPYVTIILIIFNTLFATEQLIMARILASISVLIISFVALDLWLPNNIGRLTIYRIIKYFSVDMKAKGWNHEEENNA